MNVLAFTIALSPGDRMYLANQVPYTFSTLKNYIETVQQHQKDAKDSHSSCHIEVTTLCKSLGGIPVPMIRLASDNDHEYSLHDKEAQIKKIF